ncbi:MAG: hypothetical protein IH624_07320 [Phycisphaerae bacterium]|nr:hypothetical protein [Phycisphaerae bacterium]
METSQTMTSRERVLAAFAHEEPDRVPCWLGASDGFVDKVKAGTGFDEEGVREHFGDDFRSVRAEYKGPEFLLSPLATSRSVFGVERQGAGEGRPVSHPLSHADLKAVCEYHWPDPTWIDVSTLRRQAQRYDGRYAILGGDWSPFWHDAIDLFGMETLYVLMYTAPDVIAEAMRRIVDYYMAVNQRIFDAAADLIDVFFIGNDFGSQRGALLGPQLFTRCILPHLRRLIDLGHAYRLKVQLHCCGGFAPLIPLMIEAGLDGLHAVQPSCMGMDLKTLKADFGDRILFNGAIDAQRVLLDGTAAKVRSESRKVLKIMMPGGGYVGGASHDAILEDTPIENVAAMFETIRQHGVYRR